MSEGYAKLRESINGFEADIYVPRLKLTIECDGYPWHDSDKKRKNDLKKNRGWRKAGYLVIRVRDSKLKTIPGNVVKFREKGATNHKEILIDLLSLATKLLPRSRVLSDLLSFHLKNEGFRADAQYRESSMQRVSRSGDCLADNHPDISADWDFKANAPLTPDRVSRASDFRAAWICRNCGHKWISRVGNRTSLKRGCPECARKRVQRKRMQNFLAGGNTLANRYPEVAKEWDFRKNRDFTPDSVAPFSNYRAHWVCQRCGHRWATAVTNRARLGSGCPECHFDKLRKRGKKAEKNLPVD